MTAGEELDEKNGSIVAELRSAFAAMAARLEPETEPAIIYSL